MIFTKKFRNLIYRKALKEYLTSIEICDNHGLCYAIRCVLLQLIDEGIIKKDDDPEQDGISEIIDPYFNLDQYPELADCKPAITYNKLFWFRFEETEARINILNKIINETNAK